MAQRSDFLIAVLDVCHFRALSLKSSFDVFNLRTTGERGDEREKLAGVTKEYDRVVASSVDFANVSSHKYLTEDGFTTRVLPLEPV